MVHWAFLGFWERGKAGYVSPVQTVVSYADALEATVIRVGWLFDAGWQRTRDSKGLSELTLA
eukprot:12044803-Prorocentrum_lima.AAC.1